MRIKITKLEELNDALHPNNIPVGYESIQSVPFEKFSPPKVGERFTCGRFSSSGVQEILGENTFRTYSSIYKWEVVE